MKSIRLTLAAFFLATVSLPAFAPPRSPLPLKAAIVSERLETMDIPRIKLSGKRDIQMDYLESFDIAKANNESVLLTHKFLKSNELSLSAWPATSIQGEIDQKNVADYLRKLGENAKRRQELFEVVTTPAPDGSPTKIRFLGGKPITIEYIILRQIDGEPTRVKVQENWMEMDGAVYMLKIEAPEDRFDTFFRQCKGLANSMYFLN